MLLHVFEDHIIPGLPLRALTLLACTSKPMRAAASAARTRALVARVAERLEADMRARLPNVRRHRLVKGTYTLRSACDTGARLLVIVEPHHIIVDVEHTTSFTQHRTCSFHPRNERAGLVRWKEACIGYRGHILDVLAAWFALAPPGHGPHHIWAGWDRICWVGV